MKKMYLYANHSSNGGTISVINFLKSRFDSIGIDTLKDVNFIGDYCIIAIQPKSNIYLFLNNKIPHKRKIFIFDTHPSALPLYKSIVYYILAIILKILKLKALVPNGPISKIWPFSLFEVVDWSVFINKNKINIDTSLESNSFIYMGTCSKLKNFDQFLSFALLNNKIRFKIAGYIEYKNFDISKFDNIGEFDGFTKFDNSILLWTSRIESYGLLFREYVESGGKVVFIRAPDSFDSIQDSIYIQGKKYSNLTDLILILTKKSNQINLKSSPCTNIVNVLS
jgi:hypothetical protein